MYPQDESITFLEWFIEPKTGQGPGNMPCIIYTGYIFTVSEPWASCCRGGGGAQCLSATPAWWQHFLRKTPNNPGEDFSSRENEIAPVPKCVAIPCSSTRSQQNHRETEREREMYSLLPSLFSSSGLLSVCLVHLHLITIPASPVKLSSNS